MQVTHCKWSLRPTALSKQSCLHVTKYLKLVLGGVLRQEMPQSLYTVLLYGDWMYLQEYASKLTPFNLCTYQLYAPFPPLPLPGAVGEKTWGFNHASRNSNTTPFGKVSLSNPHPSLYVRINYMGIWSNQRSNSSPYRFVFCSKPSQPPFPHLLPQDR